MSDSNVKKAGRKRSSTKAQPRELSPWQQRARAVGLQQKILAEISGKAEIIVSKQLRGAFGPKGEPPRYIVALVLAWELMTLEQREEWLAALGSKASLPSERLIRSRAHARLCEAVKARREELGLTREQVGNAIGASRFQVKAFEDGGDVPLSFALKCAEAVGLTVDTVLTAVAAGFTGDKKGKEQAAFDGIEELGADDRPEDPEFDIPDSLPDDLEPGN